MDRHRDDVPLRIGRDGAITQSTAGGNNAANYYYFFYNWVVNQPEVVCDSNRFPIFIEVNSEGCTDDSACNYAPSATMEDGSCTYPGCMDESAVNYDANAECSAGCIYLEYSCEAIGDDAWHSCLQAFILKNRL